MQINQRNCLKNSHSITEKTMDKSISFLSFKIERRQMGKVNYRVATFLKKSYQKTNSFF